MGFEVVRKLRPGDKNKGKGHSREGEAALTLMRSQAKQFGRGNAPVYKTARLSTRAVRLLGGTPGEPFYVQWVADAHSGMFAVRACHAEDADAFKVGKSQTLSAGSLLEVLPDVRPGTYRLRLVDDYWVAEPHIIDVPIRRVA